MHLLQRQQAREADPYWDHLVFLTNILLNFLLTGCFLQLIKIFAQLVITSQALPTLETPRSEVKSCSETSVCFILKQNKSEEISTNVRRKAGKMGMTPWSSVTQATSSHCLKWDGKTLQGFFKSGLCLGNTEKNLQLLLIPALCYVSLGIWQPKQYGFTKPTEILPKLYFGPTSRTRKTWAETQSSWKPQLRKSKTEQLLPNVHDISSATHTCNATHLSPKDEVTERVIHLQGEYSLPNLVLRLFIEKVTKHLWKMINSQMIFRSGKWTVSQVSNLYTSCVFCTYSSGTSETMKMASISTTAKKGGFRKISSS